MNHFVDDSVGNLENDAAAVATMRLLLDAETSGAAAQALLQRGDPLGVVFLLSGLENAGAEAREEIEAAALDYVADRTGRETLTHHLKMAQLASDPRTARVAGRLSVVITASEEQPD